jgi:hypothetical protein
MKNYKSILLLAIIVMLVSCKKNSEVVEPDNPNINHREINQEMKLGTYNSNSEMGIDINNDGMLDFEVDLYLFKTSDIEYEYEAYLDREQTGNEVLTQQIDSTAYILPMQSNALVSGGTTGWNAYSNIFEIEKQVSMAETRYGYAGNGDMLIGVRFMIGTQLHYGWLKMNVASDLKSIIVKEVAYEIRPNVEVKAGEK